MSLDSSLFNELVNIGYNNAEYGDDDETSAKEMLNALKECGYILDPTRPESNLPKIVGYKIQCRTCGGFTFKKQLTLVLVVGEYANQPCRNGCGKEWTKICEILREDKVN